MQHRSIGYRLWKHLNKKYGGSNDVSVTENIISVGGGRPMIVKLTMMKSLLQKIR